MKTAKPKKEPSIYTIQKAIDILEDKISNCEYHDDAYWRMIGRKRGLIKKLAAMNTEMEEERKAMA